MTFDPLKPGSPGPRPGFVPMERAGQRSPAAPRSVAAQPEAFAADEVHVSPQAQALSQEGEAVPAGELPASRLHEITARLASDYYDRPEVLDAIVRGVIRDLA